MKNIIKILLFMLGSVVSLHAQITTTITQIQNGQGGSISLYIQGGNPPFTFQWTKNDFL